VHAVGVGVEVPETINGFVNKNGLLWCFFECSGQSESRLLPEVPTENNFAVELFFIHCTSLSLILYAEKHIYYSTIFCRIDLSGSKFRAAIYWPRKKWVPRPDQLRTTALKVTYYVSFIYKYVSPVCQETHKVSENKTLSLFLLSHISKNRGTTEMIQICWGHDDITKMWAGFTRTTRSDTLLYQKQCPTCFGSNMACV